MKQRFNTFGQRLKAASDLIRLADNYTSITVMTAKYETLFITIQSLPDCKVILNEAFSDTDSEEDMKNRYSRILEVILERKTRFEVKH